MSDKWKNWMRTHYEGNVLQTHTVWDTPDMRESYNAGYNQGLKDAAEMTEKQLLEVKDNTHYSISRPVYIYNRDIAQAIRDKIDEALNQYKAKDE